MQYAKKSLAFGAILILIASLVMPWAPSMQVKADDDPNAGQPWSPIEISTCEELQDIASNLSGTYVVINDIDCSGLDFTPIGTGGSSFLGNLNGQGYTISHLEVPLFESTQASIITDLHIASDEVTNAGGYTGLLTGSSGGDLIVDVHTEGSITLSHSWNYTGGLIGYGYGTIIKKSSAVVNTTITTSQTVYGGLAGSLANGQVLNSYADITMMPGSGAIEHIGGLASDASGAYIANSYATGSFIGASVSVHEAGGLVWYGGNIQVVNSFSTVEGSGICGGGAESCSGLVTVGEGLDLSTDYFDQTAAGTSLCSGDAGVTCNAVNTDGSQPDYFDNNTTNLPMADWDFTDTWQTTAGLPTLRSSSNTPVDPVQDLTANIGSTRSINLEWSMPSSTGSAPLLGEVVYYQKVGDTTWTQAQSTPLYPNAPDSNFTGTSLMVDGLLPATQYTFQVVLYNQDGSYSTASVQGVTATPGTFIVNNCQDLQNIDADLTGIYELGRDIDCSDTVNWNGGLGFKPVGCVNGNANIFSGVLQGNNYTISNLYIAQSCYFMGLFAAAATSIIQDVTIANPTLHDPDGSSVKGVINGLAALNIYNNVHITGDFSGAGNSIQGGLFAVSYGGDQINQSSFVGPVTIPSSQEYFGGLFGFTANSVAGDEQITNSYVQADVTIAGESDNTSQLLIGGLLAGSDNGGLGLLRITNSYAVLTVTQEPEVTRPVAIGGLVGQWVPDEALQSFATNSFASTQISLNPSIDQNVVGGLVGIIPDYGSGGGPIDLAGNYFDADRIGTTLCAGEPDSAFYAATCNPISGQPGYFENNSTNPPLNSWDFTNIWATTSTFPVFSEKAHHTINPIPPNRLTPKSPKDDPKPVFTTTSTSKPAIDKIAAFTQPNDSPTGPTTPAPEGIISRLKEFFNRIPAAILVGFPYLLFGLLLLAALALFVEMLRQRNKLQQLKLLLAEQQAVAEKRDTFWHLAANYLRAPITLLMGGADLLALDKVSGAETSQLTTTSKRLQAKVTDIMDQIEHSHSLQGIQSPREQRPPRVWLSAGFWLPVAAVAGLIGLTDYIIHSWRNLPLNTITLVSQALIFLLVALVLYWALGAFGVANRRRRDAEALLVQQEQALDRARMKLMSQTSTELDTDVSRLQLLLAKLTTGSQAKPIMQEGATRLRHLIDSFQLLVSAQNHRLGGLSPAGAYTHLGKVLDSCVADLRPEIAAKNLEITVPAKLNLQVPGSRDLNTQLLSSVLANAVAFSPSGGKIALSTEQASDGSVRLTIADHGPGIAPAEEAHIFQPFTKADGLAGLQLDHGGLGINLYLDRQLMDHLGGEITVHGTPGQGTTVALQWPRTMALQSRSTKAVTYTNAA